MKPKAISFTPDVLKAKLRALEEYGRCHTRRPIRSDWIEALGEPELWTPLPGGAFRSFNHLENEMQAFVGPFGEVGQSLWVRERALVIHDYPSLRTTDDPVAHIRYELDGADRHVMWPSRLMPAVVGHCIPNGVHREGARHFLEVVEVRAERVADISEQDALLEGIDRQSGEWAITSYFALYDSIYGAGAHARDWCWVYTLKMAAT